MPVFATEEADDAIQIAGRASHNDDNIDDSAADRLIAFAQVKALAAVAIAIDKLAEAVISLRG